MNYWSKEIMQFYTFTFFILLTIFFSGCYVTPDESLQQFKKVDSTIDVTGSGMDSNSLVSLYNNIQRKKNKNNQLASQAEALFQSTEKADKFVDSLKNILNRLDPSGEKLDIGSKLFNEGGMPAKLVDRFNDVYNSCNSILTDSILKLKANDIVVGEKELLLSKNGMERFIHNTPTFAIITLLNKFKYDCNSLAQLSLRSIKNKLED